MLAPYQFASNTPIMAIDLDGKEALIVTGSAGVFFGLGGVEAGGGLAITPTGISAIMTGSAKFGLGISAGAGINVTLFPTVSDIGEIEGPGGGIQGSGGFLGKYSASIDYSSGNLGTTFGPGVGVGIHGAIYGSGTTVLGTVTWKDLGDAFINATPLAQAISNATGVPLSSGANATQQVYEFYRNTSLNLLSEKEKDVYTKIDNLRNGYSNAKDVMKAYNSSNFLGKMLLFDDYNDAKKDIMNIPGNLKDANAELSAKAGERAVIKQKIT